MYIDIFILISYTYLPYQKYGEKNYFNLTLDSNVYFIYIFK